MLSAIAYALITCAVKARAGITIRTGAVVTINYVVTSGDRAATVDAHRTFVNV